MELSGQTVASCVEHKETVLETGPSKETKKHFKESIHHFSLNKNQLALRSSSFFCPDVAMGRQYQNINHTI